MASICEVLRDARLDADLYYKGIMDVEVLKADMFKKFLKVTMGLAKKVEACNQEVIGTLQSVRGRVQQMTETPTPLASSPGKAPPQAPPT